MKRKEPPPPCPSAPGTAPETVALAGTGDAMPLVGLGTWKSAPGVVGDAVSAALQAGYQHIDCAHCYNNEKEVGTAIANAIRDGVVKREDLFIVSKLWNTKHGEDQVVGALRHTLAQLQLEVLDLYLIHWPQAFQRTELHTENFPKREDGTGPIYDFDLHFTETWRGMEECVRLGLVKNIGVSNFNSKQLDELLAACTIRPCVNQVEAHPLLPQLELASFCAERRIVLTAYSPLGSPDAAGRKPADPSLLGDPKIKAIGEAYGKSSAQVLVRFQTQRGIVAIPKSKTPEYICQNLDTFDFTLSEAHMRELEAKHGPVRHILLPTLALEHSAAKAARAI